MSFPYLQGTALYLTITSYQTSWPNGLCYLILASAGVANRVKEEKTHNYSNITQLHKCILTVILGRLLWLFNSDTTPQSDSPTHPLDVSSSMNRDFTLNHTNGQNVGASARPIFLTEEVPLMFCYTIKVVLGTAMCFSEIDALLILGHSRILEMVPYSLAFSQVLHTM